MAIVQISQIKHRRGLKEDLPTLEEGEIGITTDTGEMFVGTPNVQASKIREQRGEFPYGNTRILTEWTDNVQTFLDYRYMFRNSEYSQSTGTHEPTDPRSFPFYAFRNSPSSNLQTTLFSRKLQDRLDDSVSVKSYGACGNSSYDGSVIPADDELERETLAIRRAALDVSNVTNNPSSYNDWHPRALQFPAGVYAVNDSLYLPPNSTWIGDGKGKTIITLAKSVNSDKWEKRTLLFTVGGDISPEKFDGSDEPNWANDYPMSENIFISGITFRIDVDQQGDTRIPFDVIRLIRSKNVIFHDCEFIGNWGNFGLNEQKSSKYPIGLTDGSIYTGSAYFQGDVNSDTINGAGDSIAVYIDSADATVNSGYKPNNILFHGCSFSNTTYGMVLTDDVFNITIENSTFNRHFKGITINDRVVMTERPVDGTGKDDNNKMTYGLYGPRFIRVSNSYFSNIKRSAIDSYSVNNILNSTAEATGYDTYFKESGNELFLGGIISSFNRFENVGNNDTNGGILDIDMGDMTPKVTPVYPVIHFQKGSLFNVSFGDTFSRAHNEEVALGKLELAPVGESNAVRIKYYRTDENYVLIPQDFETKKFKKVHLGDNSDQDDGGSTLNDGIFKDKFLVFSQVEANSIEIHYTLVAESSTSGGNRRRIGKMSIISDTSDGGEVQFEEDYSIVGGEIDLRFEAKVEDDTIILWIVKDISEPVTIYYNIDYWNSLF